MVEHCAYLFIGEEEQAKQNKVNSIKAQYLDKHLKDIDFEVVYSSDKELSPPKFDEILSYLPSNKSKKRVVHIKNIESLNKNNRAENLNCADPCVVWWVQKNCWGVTAV